MQPLEFCIHRYSSMCFIDLWQDWVENKLAHKVCPHSCPGMLWVAVTRAMLIFLCITTDQWSVLFLWELCCEWRKVTSKFRKLQSPVTFPHKQKTITSLVEQQGILLGSIAGQIKLFHFHYLLDFFYIFLGLYNL